VVVLSIILSIKLLVFPLIERGKLMEESIQAKKGLLKRYQEALRKIPQLELRRSALKEGIESHEGILLVGKTPTLSSAELQSILEKMVKQRGAKIKSVKTLKAEDLGDYTKIWVEITFTSDVRSLLNFLYDVENYKRSLSIDQMDVHLQGRKGHQRLRTILRVEGGLKNHEISGSLIEEGVEMNRRESPRSM
jgi:type II secretory pathway component PulM